MGPAARPDRARWRAVLADAAGFARGLLRRVGPGLVVTFACIAISLWTFGELAEDVLEGEPFGFDEPLLRLAHSVASPDADRVFLVLSAVGFAWGVIPADIVLVVGLFLRRRMRDGMFAAIALAGSGLLNAAAKHTFQRDRPLLWESIAPEATHSFPSGHAMASATLACVVVLCWRGRHWRWVAVLAAAFVLGVGISRIYLGVHYPSDIVAGWAAAIGWTLVVHAAVQGRRPRAGRLPTSGA